MENLSKRLWDARRLGRTIDANACALPTTLDEAYGIQDAIVHLSGLRRRGYKVGSTSLEAQRVLGTDEPGSGPLLEPYVHDSPACISIVPAHMPAIEGEFAFRIGRDLPSRSEPYTMGEVVSAIDGVGGAIEVVGTRFSGGLSGKGRLLTTADGGVNIALAMGPWTSFSRQDLREHAVRMTINGTEKGGGTGRCALGDPLNVLLWLANHLSSRRLALKAGEIVSTGTCTGLDPVHPGDVARADFGTLGAVENEFR
ncbi:MAG: 2-keto-4-pentenoate hydratase [Hyphomicrobiaceae bacterium]